MFLAFTVSILDGRFSVCEGKKQCTVWLLGKPPTVFKTGKEEWEVINGSLAQALAQSFAF